MKLRNMPNGSWKIRRRFMFITSAFCMGVVSYCLYKDLTSVVAESAVTMAFFTLTSIVGSYVFGAVWEDSKIRESDVSREAQ